MKGLSDSFLSIKLVAMYPSFHAAYFIALNYVTDKNENGYECKELELIGPLVYYLHFFGALQQIFSLILSKFGLFTLD